MIELHQVTRRYGQQTAVDRLDLQIPAGELFAFLGPNGAGKTTTIKMMVGLLQPHGGTVKMAGFDAVSESPRARCITGYVPDQPYLYEKLSGREFLLFVSQMYGMEPAAAAASLAEQIATFDLGGFVDRLTESYSHGMKQRLAFAAALIHRPKVLVLDEPMVGLDPRSMRLVKDLLKKESQSGTTVFMSTHTLSIAEELADRIGVIDRGKLLFLGTVSQLRQRLSLHDNSLEDLFLRLTSDNGRPPPEHSANGEFHLEAEASPARQPLPPEG